MIDWVNPQAVITIVINIATLAYIAGNVQTRLRIAEKDVDELKKEVGVLRDLHSEMAVIQSELQNVNRTLLRFEQYLTKGAI